MRQHLGGMSLYSGRKTPDYVEISDLPVLAADWKMLERESKITLPFPTPLIPNISLYLHTFPTPITAGTLDSPETPDR